MPLEVALEVFKTGAAITRTYFLPGYELRIQFLKIGTTIVSYSPQDGWLSKRLLPSAFQKSVIEEDRNWMGGFIPGVLGSPFTIWSHFIDRPGVRNFDSSSLLVSSVADVCNEPFEL
ncbi:unnamed protein product [Larinioides sclopetarius]|uniref:Uncharacterized protein n=1 Tax=Larinioides sclopetarius TaxID=280406 RepID=A0AAV2ACT5_9ARAC